MGRGGVGAAPSLTPRAVTTRGRGHPDGLVHAVLCSGHVLMLKVGLPGRQAMTLDSLGTVQGYVFGKQVVRPRDCVAQPGLVDVVGLVLQMLVMILRLGSDVDSEAAAKCPNWTLGAVI